MKRSLQLDFLRFCGITLVIIHHLPAQSNLFLKVIKNGGWIGVDLFFVLSGFLVSSLIIHEYKTYNSFDLKRFLIRRGFKIYPTYYIFIFYQFLFSYFLTNYPQSISGLLNESIFISNYFTHNNNHLWSISVEEHFYFTLALLFFLLIKLKKVKFNVIFTVYLIFFISGICFRLNNYLTHDNYDFDRDYSRSHFRFDALFFGVLLAYLVNYHDQFINSVIKSKYNKLILLICFSGLVSNFMFNREEYRIMQVINLALNPILFGIVMLYIISYQNALFLRIIKPFSLVGMYSYSIYLFHLHLLQIANKLFTVNQFQFYCFYLIGALVVGISVSRLIEIPLMGYRDKYFPGASKKITMPNKL